MIANRQHTVTKPLFSVLVLTLRRALEEVTRLPRVWLGGGTR